MPGRVAFGAKVDSGMTMVTVVEAVVSTVIVVEMVVSTGTGTGTTTEEVGQTSTVTVVTETVISWAAARAAKAVRRRVAACILVGIEGGFLCFGVSSEESVLVSDNGRKFAGAI